MRQTVKSETPATAEQRAWLELIAFAINAGDLSAFTLSRDLDLLASLTEGRGEAETDPPTESHDAL